MHGRPTASRPTATLHRCSPRTWRASIDGAVIQSLLLNTGNMAPCLIQASDPDLPTAKVGGQTAVVTYAGWVADSVAGLYQVNIQLPANSGATSFTLPDGVSHISGITAPVQLPVVVRANGVSSQSNVTIWVAPRLDP